VPECWRGRPLASLRRDSRNPCDVIRCRLLSSERSPARTRRTAQWSCRSQDRQLPHVSRTLRRDAAQAARGRGQAHVRNAARGGRGRDLGSGGGKPTGPRRCARSAQQQKARSVLRAWCGARGTLRVRGLWCWLAWCGSWRCRNAGPAL